MGFVVAQTAGLDFMLMPGLDLSLGHYGNLGGRDQANCVRAASTGSSEDFVRPHKFPASAGHIPEQNPGLTVLLRDSVRDLGR